MIGIAGCIADRRDNHFTDYNLKTLLHQRTYQIVTGTEKKAGLKAPLFYTAKQYIYGPIVMVLYVVLFVSLVSATAPPASAFAMR